MGITVSGKRMLDIAISKIGKNLNNLRMFEFGNQEGVNVADAYGDMVVPFSLSKTYYSELGVEHISLDLNGDGGALKRDMTGDISDLGKFDIVTDFGSSEHIEPLDGNYKAFRNYNLLCEVGGFMIHHLPPIGSSWGISHCPALYKPTFFHQLAKLNDYEIVYFDSSDEISLTGVIYRKTREGFIEEKDFPYNEIVWDTNKQYTDYKPTWK